MNLLLQDNAKYVVHLQNVFLPERAVEVWAVAQAQPLVAHSRWFAEVVGRVIAEKAKTLTPEAAAAAQERGQALDFWATAQKVAQELPGNDLMA